jgi:hypothetical protein
VEKDRKDKRTISDGSSLREVVLDGETGSLGIGRIGVVSVSDDDALVGDTAIA